MDWTRYADTWPNAEHSAFAQARPHRWHVQALGPEDAPVLLLLHGAGGATHSWRDLAPLLARRWRVVAPDLPGHGFTRLGALQRSSLDLMAADLETLLEKRGERPAAIVGHSAGGALALRMAQIAQMPPAAIVGVNAALDNFDGAAGFLFPMMARALALNPLVAPTMARLAQPGTVQRLIEGTGSRLDDLGLALYRACVSDARHVDGTLTMMAQWRLERLRAALHRTEVPTLLLAADRDRAVSPETSERAARKMPRAEAVTLQGLGHLAHEEAPEEMAARIDAFLARHL
ncbi:MAG: alpha/beta fold hydrolase BchO [Paracoccaceae bacterium]|nr:alpha/beta fold hydrolase BchO [Paracoccaceae bacterium]